MTTLTPYNLLLITWFILAAATFVVLFFVTAPYGRHSRGGWGPSIGGRLAWIIMEAPAPVVFALCFLAGVDGWTMATFVLLIMWEFHYVYRAFLYPFLHRSDAKRMPLLVVGIALVFGFINTCLVGSHLYSRPDYYADQ